MFTGPIRAALEDLPAVDLAVAYGVRRPGAAAELAVAAVTLRAGYELAAQDIGLALREPTSGLTPSAPAARATRWRSRRR